MSYKLTVIHPITLNNIEELFEIPEPPKELYDRASKQFQYACPRCMAKISDNTAKCQNCGQAIKWNSTVVTSVKFINT
ncbi:MAG: hypothetical protein ACOX7J_08705 [Bacillota bacterium]|jgi:hypothetical protein